MARPKGSTGIKNRKWTIEEKIEIVNKHLKDHLSYKQIKNIYHVNLGQIHTWVKKYLESGEEGLHRKKQTSHPEMGLFNKKNLTETERLKLENFKLRIENERLKKGYTVKGVGSNKEYVPISKMSTRSSKT